MGTPAAQGGSAYPYNAFFGPWEPPPSFVPAPDDPGLRDRCGLLVRHCLASGPAFLSTVRERQAADPALAPLLFGSSAPYFKWALWCALHGMPPDQPPPAAAAAPGAPQPTQQHYQHSLGTGPPGQQPAATAYALTTTAQPPPAPAAPTGNTQLTPEVEAGFTQVLEGLSGSKDAIKSAQQWFMACGPSAAAGLARLMAVRCVAPSTQGDRRMHLIYLVNDILFKGLGARPAGSGPAADPIATALQPVLPAMLAATWAAGGKTEELSARLTKILAFWGERGVYDAPVIASMQQSMAGAGSAGGSQEPEPEPVSSFSVPPGLLPALCRKRQESGARPYDPLFPDEIEEMGLPPPPSRTDYLASRLERFYAEIRDYRPGLTRADVEDPSHSWHRQRLRREAAEDPEGLRQRWWRGGGRRHAGGRGEGRLHADGTFSGTGSLYAGLGAHVAAATPDPGRGVSPAAPDAQPGDQQLLNSDPAGGTGAALPSAPLSLDDTYQSYRLARSGGYHAMIMANAAKAQTLGPPRRAAPRP